MGNKFIFDDKLKFLKQTGEPLEEVRKNIWLVDSKVVHDLV